MKTKADEKLCDGQGPDAVLTGVSHGVEALVHGSSHSDDQCSLLSRHRRGCSLLRLLVDSRRLDLRMRDLGKHSELQTVNVQLMADILEFQRL